jgi:His-Xaa-Ser system protein HxsD
MTIQIDRNIFDDAAISKTIYWLSGDFSFQRRLEGEIESITITPKPGTEISDLDIELAFLDKLNDYKLRGIIANETKDIRTILYAKAFADDDNLSEEDLNE